MDTPCRPVNPPGTHTKLEKDQTSVVAQPTYHNHLLQALNTKQNDPIIDPRSIFTSYNLYDHEIERIPQFPEWFRTKKWIFYLSFEKYNFNSQTVMKFNRLIFKSIGWFHLT